MGIAVGRINRQAPGGIPGRQLKLTAGDAIIRHMPVGIYNLSGVVRSHLDNIKITVFGNLHLQLDKIATTVTGPRSADLNHSRLYRLRPRCG